jgi:hypothetical protein
MTQSNPRTFYKQEKSGRKTRAGGGSILYARYGADSSRSVALHCTPICTGVEPASIRTVCLTNSTVLRWTQRAELRGRQGLCNRRLDGRCVNDINSPAEKPGVRSRVNPIRGSSASTRNINLTLRLCRSALHAWFPIHGAGQTAGAFAAEMRRALIRSKKSPPSRLPAGTRAARRPLCAVSWLPTAIGLSAAGANALSGPYRDANTKAETMAEVRR